MTDAHHRAAIAERAARAGGVVARERFRGSFEVETKADKTDLVTIADREAQQQVVATIREEFSGDQFVCEEDSPQLAGPESDAAEATLVESVPESGPAWIVDPIDGTTNFVRGNRTWATSVTALVDGEPVGSANYLPAMGDLYAAGPESVTRDGKSMRVSEETDTDAFLVAVVNRWEDATAFGDLCRIADEELGDVRRLGSFQATLSLLADGGFDAAVCTQSANAWDTVAGVHMVRAAGGTVTDVDGDRWTPDSEGMVASNGSNHGAVLDAVAQVRGESAD
ncbi:inositol monophosphatase [Halomicrobium sp. LC1Hm]|uniref:inositol monophosphatase family protein n=1 Tax=Halomicrobium sp. LC1Hm TaxID=2610902 RepID=UPI001298253F|nr:inositol monophosphatase [Halomicrobium sp. LC1Hm]QGA82648.1 Inositol-1-monophosphatase [Halomicrobium sp. LC1Hm]